MVPNTSLPNLTEPREEAYFIVALVDQAQLAIANPTCSKEGVPLRHALVEESP